MHIKQNQWHLPISAVDQFMEAYLQRYFMLQPAHQAQLENGGRLSQPFDCWIKYQKSKIGCWNKSV
jgi:hypothetical protein